MSSRRLAKTATCLLLTLLGSIGVLVLNSCSVAKFTMQESFAYPVRAVVLTRPNTVKRTHDNGLEIKGPARVGLRAERVTHGQFSVEIIRQSASPLTIQTRTTPHDDSVLGDRGLVITIAGDSTVVEQNGQRSTIATPVPIGKPFVVEIRNFGRIMQLRVHHTECGEFSSQLHCTEWVIISVSDTSRIFVGDPWFNTII